MSRINKCPWIGAGTLINCHFACWVPGAMIFRADSCSQLHDAETLRFAQALLVAQAVSTLEVNEVLLVGDFACKLVPHLASVRPTSSLPEVSILEFPSFREAAWYLIGDVPPHKVLNPTKIKLVFGSCARGTLDPESMSWWNLVMELGGHIFMVDDHLSGNRSFDRFNDVVVYLRESAREITERDEDAFLEGFSRGSESKLVPFARHLFQDIDDHRNGLTFRDLIKHSRLDFNAPAKLMGIFGFCKLTPTELVKTRSVPRRKQEDKSIWTEELDYDSCHHVARFALPRGPEDEISNWCALRSVSRSWLLLADTGHTFARHHRLDSFVWREVAFYRSGVVASCRVLGYALPRLESRSFLDDVSFPQQ